MQLSHLAACLFHSERGENDSFFFLHQELVNLRVPLPCDGLVVPSEGTHERFHALVHVWRSEDNCVEPTRFLALCGVWDLSQVVGALPPTPCQPPWLGLGFCVLCVSTNLYKCAEVQRPWSGLLYWTLP